MLVIKLSNGRRNFLHFIWGAQSEHQLDMFGLLHINISRGISAFEDQSLPCSLFITRCDDEMETYHNMLNFWEQTDQQLNDNGVMVGDNMQTAMFDTIATTMDAISEKIEEMKQQENNNEQTDNVSTESIPKHIPTDSDTKGPIKKDTKGAESPRPVLVKTSSDLKFNFKATYMKGDPRGVYLADCLCALCRKAGVYINKGVAVMCADCLKIEYGRGTIKNEPDKKEDTTEAPQA